MASCQACDQVLNGQVAAVCCNGSCQRRVHPWCAKTSGVMLAANGTELYWFCDACRRGLSPVPKDSGDSGPLIDALRKLKRRLDTMDDSLRKIERSVGGTAAKPNPDLPELPVEIWTEIFMEMSADQCLKMRLVCRRWKGIVDGSSALMAKFTVTFRDLVIAGDYKPVHLLPVSKANFEAVKIKFSGTWWKTFGPGLAEIRLGRYCCIDTPILMELLKNVPNLKKLELFHVVLDFSNENVAAMSDFKLINLEELTITGIEEESFNDNMLKLCCNLKSLRFYHFSFAPLETARTVARLHNTLEELCINSSADFLVELMKLDRLKLKKLTLAGYEENCIIIKFCKMLPNLEYLDVHESLDLDELDEAGCNDFFKLLPKLEFLSICVGNDCQMKLKFLSNLTRLQSLSLTGKSKDYSCCLASSKLPSLRQLQLRDIDFSDNLLQQGLANMPNLCSITIEDCNFDCWSDLLEALESSKLLEHLTIIGMEEVSETPCYYHDEFIALKTLQLEGCNLSADMLGKLLGLCPGLRELGVKHVNVNDEKLGIVCRELTQLSKLTFVSCKLPKNTEKYVRENGHLAELKIIE